ncbi:hypothetical protein LX73_0979 [Fodinibius salinus]|uniref:Uncharacterized protein n=1 Tax=Fodinibius salinus TaxID=860790 RepID=A0A5D3YP59_9BACT|nr:hypothetical protein [Fodinibius salinus]TYP95664.1 hypothetical protein LX73_0979 [Fodinibius salinus]
MLRSVFITLIIAITCHSISYGQEIDFGDYGNYNLSVGVLNTNTLYFGQLVSGSGTSSTIPISSASIIYITGVEYIDVIVDVTTSGQGNLLLNGNPAHIGDSQKSLPFNLQAAYANNKDTPNIGQAKFITSITANNSFTKQFPILERQNRPPGPPPTPPTNAFDQSKVEDTAYLYLYGSIPNVGNVDAGSYSSQITITINYD